MEDVSVIPGSISRGFGINGFDQMVGDSTFGKGRTISHAALFSKGSILDLAPNTGVLGSYSRANGINALGQVVGSSGPKLDSSDSRDQGHWHVRSRYPGRVIRTGLGD